jgi:hypothetical protein
MRSIGKRAPLFLALFAAVARGQAPSITALPGLPGGGSPSMVPRGISRDGSTVVGEAYAQTNWHGVRWTAQGGIEDLAPAQTVFVANSDGSVVAGLIGPQAARWTSGGGWVNLFAGTPGGLNASGTIVVGRTASPVRACLWEQGTGLTMLPLPTGATESEARALSADGAYVFGGAGNGGNSGVRWPIAGSPQAYTGVVGTFVACAADGSAAAGLQTLALTVGTRWTPSGVQPLPTVPGYQTGAPVAMSADGRFIYGMINNSTPYLWDAAHGSRLLQPYLASTYGLNFAGITLLTLTAVTPDSTCFVGQMATPQGERGYLIRVPPPPLEPPAPQWQSMSGLPGVNGTVLAMGMWDPDGSGPHAPVLVAGGNFTIAGDQQATNIATLDLATRRWSRLGWGLSSPNGSAVRALAVLPTGELVAGGAFSNADGLASGGVAKWSGSAWVPLGTNLVDVQALAVLGNGTLVGAGGIAGVIAQWDGTTWVPLPGGGFDNTVHALAVDQNGGLVAGGLFLHAGGTPVNRIARWNGSTWSPLGEGLSARVRAVLLLPGGEVIAAGQFDSAGGVSANRIARWDGAQWSPLGLGLSGGDVNALALLPGGDIVAGGVFNAAGAAPANRVARWDGAAWSPLGAGLVTAGANASALLVLPDGRLVAGGSFAKAGTVPAMSAAAWDGSDWSALSGGLNGQVLALASAANADLLVGGSFTNAGGPANNIARLSGSQWSALGSGVIDPASPTTWVYSIVAPDAEQVVAGGGFTNAGGTLARFVARWDGQQWGALGQGFNGPVASLALYHDRIVAGGSFTLSGGVPVRSVGVWNGTGWLPLGGGGTGGVYAMRVVSGERLVVGGGLTTLLGPGIRLPANSIAAWDGSWMPFGQGIPGGGIRAIAELPNGDIVAAGSFTTTAGAPANRIARWNGSSWVPFGLVGGTASPLEVRALAVMPSGELVMGGTFDSVDGLVASCIARWDGTSWLPIGLGVGGTGAQHASVDALHATAAGDLVVGGYFFTAGDQASPYLAKLSFPTCYANCDGSTVQPVLNVLDFNCFLNRFSAGDTYANCDGSTVPPVLNVLDFNCFLNRFSAGCP